MLHYSLQLTLIIGIRLQKPSRAAAFPYDICDLLSSSGGQVGRRVLRHSCVTYRTVSALPSDPATNAIRYEFSSLYMLLVFTVVSGLKIRDVPNSYFNI